MIGENKIRPIALYLPQYHPILKGGVRGSQGAEENCDTWLIGI